MSNYSTDKKSSTKPHTTKGLRNYVMQGDTSEDNERLLGDLSNALFAMQQRFGIKTDHSPSDPTVMTLDIYQVQQAIVCQTEKLYTHMEIIDALYCLNEPKLMQPSTVVFNSELDGKRIDAVRLDYSVDTALVKTNPNLSSPIADAMRKATQSFSNCKFPIMPPRAKPSSLIGMSHSFSKEPIWPEFKLHIPELDEEKDICADALCVWHKNISQADSWEQLGEYLSASDAPDELTKCDASRRWIAKSMWLEEKNLELQNQQQGDKKSISNLKSVLDDLQQTNSEMKETNLLYEKSAKDWKQKAFENYEQYEIAQMTIESLRCTIIEMAETLYAADGNARISVTSGELLELLHRNSDSSDTPF